MVERSRKPNILIVVIDSLRADHVSCYGYERQTTPNIDQLAAEGCLFETCITAAPFSPASYASIFSNLYPHQHGVNGDTVRVWPDTWPRLPEFLQQHGYFTFCVTNNSFVSRPMNGARGFDVFVDVPGPGWCDRQYARFLWRIRRRMGHRLAERLSSNRMQCLEKGHSQKTVHSVGAIIDRAARPFFGFVILMDPHIPYRKSRTLYSNSTPAFRRFLRKRNSRSMWAELMARRTSLSDTELEVVHDLYDAEIRHSDACIGELVTTLRATRELDETVLVVTADHGEAFGERGVWGHGFCLNDCLTHVPLIVRCPSYWPQGTRCPVLVQLHDIHDTCRSLATDGVPRPDTFPHCLTQARDAAWTGRDVVFSEFPQQTKTLRFMSEYNLAFEPGVWGGASWAVRSANWRYIEYDSGRGEYYDLRNDPLETTPVASPPTCVNSELRRRLDEHRSDAQHKTWANQRSDEEELSEVVLQRLRALGYVE